MLAVFTKIWDTCGMESEIFLIFAGLLLVFDLILLSVIKRGKQAKSDYGIYAAIMAFILILASYGRFSQAFISNDFSFIGVYSYSSSGLSIFSKIYASWGGARGSMIFLAFILSIIYLIFRVKTHKSRRDDFSVFTTRILNVILLVFLVVSLVGNPFEQYSVMPVEGLGLNPQLQTFWMIIHPPIIFAAYAFVVLAYALTLAAMRNNRDFSELKLLRISAYTAWLLLSVGIALGGVWAYEVLGWGGYWAWDPVETASLLPWLFLTALFYLNHIAKSRSYSREFMILLTFSSLVFLSALTRGGAAQSVHSYAISPVGPIMMTFALGMILYFFYLKRPKRQPLFKLNVNKASLKARSSFIIFWALIFIALVCFVGLTFQNFSYNLWTFPFVAILIIGLIGYSLNERAPLARLLLLTIGGLVAGFVVALLPSDLHIIASLGVPLLVVAVLMAFYRLIQVTRQKSSRQFGRSLMTLGIVLILLGVFISAGAKTSASFTDVKLNSPVEDLGVRIEVTNLSVGTSQSRVYYQQLDDLIPEYAFLKADSTVKYLGKTYHKTLRADFYPNYGLVLRPLIIPTEIGDLYIHLEYTEEMETSLVEALREETVLPDITNISVQTSPLIYVLWAGIITMVLGITTQLFIELKLSTKDVSHRSNNKK
jgi:cytochrome c-type biogenesis protein CcmF